ncbi:MAG: 3-phosphoshikimate 1-carboxyvinyltransferase, partial [Gemmatimonadota bacterium]
AALAQGRSTIHGVLQSADIQSTARVLRALGVAVSPLAHVMSVEGVGLRGVRQPDADLDCGNSGTTARLMLGILSAQSLLATLVGDASLSRRPMRRVAEPLRAMGATVALPSGHDGLPLTVTGGALRSIDWISPVASAQVKSAILLAGLCAGVPVSVTEPNLSRDHTERMLRSLGTLLRSTLAADGSHHVAIEPGPPINAFEVHVPGDPSSGAYFAGLAAMAATGTITLRGIALNPTRTGFLAVLRRMGVVIDIQTHDALGEPVGDVSVRANDGRLVATSVTANEVPSLIDEVPLLACVAALAEGVTTIRGASELRVKESDRIAATVSNLRALGFDAAELPDGLRIQGNADAQPRGIVRTFGDHRIAMAFATLGAATGAGIDVDDPDCVAISYPDFWRDLARVTDA